jgi:hypothetical protein
MHIIINKSQATKEVRNGENLQIKELCYLNHISCDVLDEILYFKIGDVVILPCSLHSSKREGLLARKVEVLQGPHDRLPRGHQ